MFRRGRDEQAIDHAWQPAEPHVEPGPLQRGAVGQDFAARVALEGGGGCAGGVRHPKNKAESLKS